MKPIILASTSPRRKELLKKLGVKFQIAAGNYEEVMDPAVDPVKLAKMLSAGKARAIAARHPHHVIIAADTFVALRNELLGKPHTKREAARMLKKISGKRISVITGFTILDTSRNKKTTRAVTTEVHIKALSGREITRYVQTGEPLDKAGAFAIQGIGSVLVKKIDGDFYNVMGLPLFALSQALPKFGIRVLL